jgi:CRP/FNR family transcriptional regulator, cyclic AMP receptor protein
MFCNLDAQALADFDSLGLPATVEGGTKVFDEDTQVRNVYVVCTGRVKLSCTSKEGKILILKIAVAGDVLGLGAALSGSRYEVTAETIEPTQMKAIPQKEFLAFIERHGEASMHAARALSDEYRAAFFDVKRLALSVSAAARLASVLLDWGRESSYGKTEMRFTMTLTHEELASLIGSSRETVTRMLGRFRRDKLIEIHGMTMLILAPDKLEQMAA